MNLNVLNMQRFVRAIIGCIINIVALNKIVSIIQYIFSFKRVGLPVLSEKCLGIPL